MKAILPLRLGSGRAKPRAMAWKVLGVCGGLFLAAWIGRALRIPSDPASLPPSPGGSFRVSLEAKPDELDLYRATDLLVETLVQIESGGDPLRVGGVGERGLMQIRPGTWREVTRRHMGEALPFDLAFDPATNRRVGRLYLGDLQAELYRNRHRWKSDLRSLLFAAYNAGPRRVRGAGYDLARLPRSVRDYAERASALHDWHLSHDAIRLRALLDEARPPPPP